MKTWVKRILLILLVGVIGGAIWLYRFIDKAKNGIERYETTPHDIDIPADKAAILVLSKTNGFRHSEAITASIPMFDAMAKRNNWFIYQTEDAGIFNTDQLNQFEAIIFNNATGPVLNPDQKSLLEQYVDTGGGIIGIHGAGDASHKWPWYRENVICADFSHHPLKNQLQDAKVTMQSTPDSSWSLSPSWNHVDEWYIFFNNPANRGATITHTINGHELDSNGDLLWMKGGDTKMKQNHPVAWYNTVGNGKAFYTSIGHTGPTYSDDPFIELIQSAIEWVIK